MGSIRGADFKRFVYEGPYDKKDFTDSQQRVVGSDVLRKRLADRRLAKLSRPRRGRESNTETGQAAKVGWLQSRILESVENVWPRPRDVAIVAAMWNGIA